MEESISLACIFSAVIRAWKKVFVVALAVAVALGGFQGYKQISLANDPSNTPEQIEQRYTEAVVTYEAEKERLERTLEMAERAYASKQEYMEESPIHKIDPYNEHVAYITVSFTGINEGEIFPIIPYEGIAAEYMVNTVRAQYMELWKCMDVAQVVNDLGHTDIEEKYLRELIFVEEKEGGLLEVRAYANTATEAELFANSVYNYLSEQQEMISESSYAHQLLVINRATKCIINEGLINAQQSAKDSLLIAEQAVSEAQAELDALEAPQKEAGYGIPTMAKAVLKYVLIGLAAGAALACFGICCMALFSSKISDSYQMERMSGLRFVGSLNVPQNVFDKYSCRLVAERTWANAEMAGAYLVEQVSTLCGDDKQLLILSTLPAKKAQRAADGLNDLLSANGFAVKTVLDAAHNPETIRAIQSGSKILLAESTGVSRMGAVLDVAAQVKTAEKQILGFVMI